MKISQSRDSIHRWLYHAFVTHGWMGSTNGQNRRRRDTRWKVNLLTTLFLLFSRMVSMGSSAKVPDSTGFYRPHATVPVGSSDFIRCYTGGRVSLKMGHKTSFTWQLFCYTAGTTGHQVQQDYRTKCTERASRRFQYSNVKFCTTYGPFNVKAKIYSASGALHAFETLDRIVVLFKFIWKLEL